MAIDGFETVSIDAEDIAAAPVLVNTISKQSTNWPPTPKPDGRPSTLITRKCAEEGCEEMLCHFSKTGIWNYPGAKCDKHSGAKSR